MGTAPPRTFTSPSGTPLSTTNQKTGQPHNCYKYLGVYIFWCMGVAPWRA